MIYTTCVTHIHKNPCRGLTTAQRWSLRADHMLPREPKVPADVPGFSIYCHVVLSVYCISCAAGVWSVMESAWFLQMLLTDDVETGLCVLNFVQTSHRQTAYDWLILWFCWTVVINIDSFIIVAYFSWFHSPQTSSDDPEKVPFYTI